MRSEAAQQVDKNVEQILKNQKAGKLVNRGKDEEQLDQLPNGKATVVFTKDQLVKFKQQIESAIERKNRSKEVYDKDKGAVATAYANAAKAGVPKDELKFIIEKHSKYDEDFKQGVGALEEMLGLEPTFHFVEPEGHDALKH